MVTFEEFVGIFLFSLGIGGLSAIVSTFVIDRIRNLDVW